MGVIFLDFPSELTKEWEFIASTMTSSSSLTLPASISAGDLLVIFNSCTQPSTSPTLVTPSGFTNKIDLPFFRLSNSSRSAVHVKKATGSEDGSSVTCMSGDIKTAVCLQFRPVNFSISSVANITLSNLDSGGDYENPAFQTANTTGVKLPAIAMGQASSYTKSATVPFSTQSPTFDGTIQTSYTNTHQQIVGYRIQNDVVTSQTIDMTDQGIMNHLFVFQLYDNGV
jgi:hypothetical protein